MLGNKCSIERAMCNEDIIGVDIVENTAFVESEISVLLIDIQHINGYALRCII
jgi:hypothetical protein